MINLITSFYISKLNHPKIKKRNKEIQECLNKNINSIFIEKIYLYLDDEIALNYVKNLNTNKITIIDIGKKPLYSDLFGYGINNLQGKICMISNSDIYLHDCDLNVINKLNEDNTVFSLSRYEYDMSCPQITGYGGSHDSFIFKSPLNTELLNHIQHLQHYWNSEGVVLYELNKIGAKLYNPCYQIKTVHLHKSDIREPNRITYSDERRFLLPPCNL